jgi:hypothetical protein
VHEQPLLPGSTMGAAVPTAADAVTAVVSAWVAALTKGVLKAMFSTRRKIVPAAALLAALLAIASCGIGSAPPPGGKRHEAAQAELLTPEQAVRQRPNKKVTVEFKVNRARVYGNLADTRGEDLRTST